MTPRSIASARHDRRLVMRLLAYAATGGDATGGVAMNGIDPRQLRWVIDAGFGPLLHRAAGRDGVPSHWRDTLLSEDLSAQVRHGNRIDTAVEVIDVCAGLRVSVTLLKGISVSEQHYPSGHLRPMGDVDLLVPAAAHAEVEAALLRLGYHAMPGFETGPETNHGVPLAHPRLGTWVELHVPPLDPNAPAGLFGAAHLAAQSVLSEFRGRDVYRLSDSAQLLYLAHTWMADLARYNTGIHPSGLAPLFDAVYIMKSTSGALDFDAFLGWPDGQMPLASLYVTLAYLHRHGLASCEAATLARLRDAQRIVGALQRRTIHAMLDRYLVGGRPWNHPIPPPVPGRYKPRRQLGKLLRRLGLARGRRRT